MAAHLVTVHARRRARAAKRASNAYLTLALLRATGHQWDTLMVVDGRYLHHLDNHWHYR